MGENNSPDLRPPTKIKEPSIKQKLLRGVAVLGAVSQLFIHPQSTEAQSLFPNTGSSKPQEPVFNPTKTTPEFLSNRNKNPKTIAVETDHSSMKEPTRQEIEDYIFRIKELDSANGGKLSMKVSFDNSNLDLDMALNLPRYSKELPKSISDRPSPTRPDLLANSITAVGLFPDQLIKTLQGFAPESRQSVARTVVESVNALPGDLEKNLDAFGIDKAKFLVIKTIADQS